MSTGLGWGNVRLLWLYMLEWSKDVGVTDVKELLVPFIEWTDVPKTLETGLIFLPEIDDPGEPDFCDLPWIWKKKKSKENTLVEKIKIKKKLKKK